MDPEIKWSQISQRQLIREDNDQTDKTNESQIGSQGRDPSENALDELIRELSNNRTEELVNLEDEDGHSCTVCGRTEELVPHLCDNNECLKKYIERRLPQKCKRLQAKSFPCTF